MRMNLIKKKVAIHTFILFSLICFACYLLYYAYAQRSVSALFWAISFILAAWASFSAFLRSFCIAIISITVTLALVEAGLAYLPELMAKKTNEATPRAYFDTSFSYSTPAYWQLGPFGSQPQVGIFQSRALANNGGVIYTATYTIGADGFRVTPQFGVDLKVVNNMTGINLPRINFLGDSFIFGEGLNDDQTMEYFTGKIALEKNQPVVVKNYGVHGWGMHQALAVLQSKLDTKANLQYAQTSPWHASRSACVDFYSFGSPKYRLLANGLVERDGYCRSFSWLEKSPKAIRGLVNSSKIYQLLIDSLFVTADQDQQIQLYLGILKTMQADLKQKGQPFILGFIKADEKWFVGSYNNEKILAAIKALDIEVIDMTLASKNEELAKQYYIHELDKHPSALGNQERASILFPLFRNLPL